MRLPIVSKQHLQDEVDAGRLIFKFKCIEKENLYVSATFCNCTGCIKASLDKGQLRGRLVIDDIGIDFTPYMFFSIRDDYNHHDFIELEAKYINKKRSKKGKRSC